MIGLGVPAGPQLALGGELLAEGRVVRRGGTICFCEVNVTDVQGARVAQSVVTYKLS